MSANRFFKDFFSRFLVPIARMSRNIHGPVIRLWSFAKLRAVFPLLDSSVVVLGRIDIVGSRSVDLGRNLYLYRDIHIETQIEGKIDIGDDVVISRGVHLVSHHHIQIGAGSMIGEYASIRDADHRFGPGIKPRHSGHVGQPIVIGRNVWIGRGASILSGVSIGDGAVVGANAAVTRDVLPNAVVGGVPARPLLRSAA